MNLNEYADKIEKAALTVSFLLRAQLSFLMTSLQTIAEGKHVTGDLGGKASTKEYTQAIITKLTA
jgi:isocitrate dehydrogenase (NAD+)